MPKPVAVFLAALLACSAGCARRSDVGDPVATPSVALSRAEAAPGRPLDITYRFVVAADAPPFEEDYLVFVHFVDTSGDQMWTDDHEPPTPTQQWMPGQEIEYTRTIFIPKFPYVGTANLHLGLYSPQTGERLRLTGRDVGLRAYQVGSFTMARQPEEAFVIFSGGFYEPEAADDSGVEWQWSRQEGTMAFRNPKVDSELFLQVDQPVAAFSQPQRVEVRLGSSTIDSFTLPVGVRELRRIALPAALLGQGDTVEILVAVDKTFVPAEVPGLRSSDPRELGIRVFRGHVEPK